MSESDTKLANEFDAAVARIYGTTDWSDSSQTSLLLSVLRRKFATAVELAWHMQNSFAVHLSIPAIRISHGSQALLCFERLLVDTSLGQIVNDLSIQMHLNGGGGRTCIVVTDTRTAELGECMYDNYVDAAAISTSELRDIIARSEWVHELSTLLRRGKDKSRISPFSEVSYCRNDLFVGRTRELSSILAHPTGPISVIGCRRVGKSSLLLRARAYLEARQEKVHYLDLRGCSTSKRLLDRLVFATNFRGYVRKGHQICEPYDYIRQLCAKSSGIVNLFLDEIDDAVAADRKGGFQMLSGIISGEAEKPDNLRLCVAGYKQLYQEIERPTGAFFGVCQARQLGPLLESEVRALIVPILAQTFDTVENQREIVESIHSVTGGHPATVQMLGRLLCALYSEERHKSLDLERVTTVYDHPKFHNHVTSAFDWNTSPLEKLIVLANLEHDFITIESAQDALEGAYRIQLNAESMMKELEDLRFGGILKQVAYNKYQYLYPAMTTVLREHAPLQRFAESNLPSAQLTARKLNEGSTRNST